MVVTILVTGARSLGIFQAWELKTYDQLLRLRPDEGQDNRILVVEVTEEDFEYQDKQGWKERRGSLADAALVQLLETLKPYQPRAIGLDIYRDFKVGDDYPDLATRFKQNNNFFATCKGNDLTTDDIGVKPPPDVPLERLGFSDVVLDSDGVLRRYLWYATFNSNSPCPVEVSLSLQLALHYLAAEGIEPELTREGQLQLDKIRLKHLERPAGGYQKFDDSGYQMLLNYRTRGDIAQKVTLADVLKGEFDPSLIRDRIVLIGVTTHSVKDDFSTPFSRQQDQTMRGVFIHAQMASQILSAVLDGRPLLWVLPQWGEVLWVWVWSLMGGLMGIFLAWCCRSRLPLGLALGTAAAVTLPTLSWICFFLLTQGLWVPLVPSALALVLISGGTWRFSDFTFMLLQKKLMATTDEIQDPHS